MSIPLKTTRNLELPALGLGTYLLGGDQERDPKNDDAGQIEAIKRAVAAGIAHIDTAESYAAGHAETLVGQAIAGLERKNLFIASKVSRRHHNYKDILASAEASLERLRTSYLDLYLLHAPHSTIPFEETFKAMDELVDRKLARHIGVSNFTAEQLERAEKAARHPIACNQIHYGVAARAYERDGTIDYCRSRGILVVAYWSLGEEDMPGWDVLEEIAKRYKKTPHQIALRWVVQQPGVAALVKMRQPRHLEANLDVLAWELAPEDMERLARDVPAGATLNRSPSAGSPSGA